MPDVWLVAWFGMMPVEWSDALDPGQIWSGLGFFLLTFLLLWLELQVEVKNNAPFNKAVVLGHRLVWRRGADEFLLAGRGGEGKKLAGALICASGRWRGSFLLQIGENHTMAMDATVICDRRGGLSKRLLGVSSTSSAEALTEASCRISTASRRQVVRPRRCQVGRRRKLTSGGEDPGLDCVSSHCFRVFSVKFQDCVVFYFFSRGPVSKMYPPTV